MKLEHHDVRDVIGPNAFAAVRAFRRYQRSQRGVIETMNLAEGYDAHFDGGEFSAPAWGRIWEEYYTDRARPIAARFGLTTEQLMNAVELADNVEGDCWMDATRRR